ncbi:MAG: phospholipase C, phosphocholine-specific [Bacteroidetes bacterium]|nr:MAG: phospholipase C, phosphocholine-specific [Bacteroidota bacterium]
MDTRRSFIKKASILSGGAGMLHVLPASIAKALAIDPAPGSTYLDAEHVVLLMQENRSFDHTYGTLQGVRGFNDPRAIPLPNKNRVWLQPDENGDTYAPFRFDIKNTKITWMDSLPHTWTDQVDARNNGKYDKWLITKHPWNDDYRQMPLTLGYYTRADIPFYYSLADAFTVCDQNFCSSLTGTTPNRLYFWTGTIREKQDENAIARVWNEDADYETMVNWKTFPERLEENGVSWKIYQNEISVGVGFNEEEDPWLANFGDNPIEYFSQFHVKLSPEYIANIPRAIAQLEADIQKREQKLPSIAVGSKEAENIKGEIEWLKKRLATTREDQKNCTLQKFEELSDNQKSLHRKAFSTNREDPFYHQLTTLRYKDGNADREVKIPKGDILHEFRQDVTKGKLPAVSWIVAPQNFSDHPSSAWYGAWYISEVMDILTQNPEVWKKTIFILTYDENDGYFDHVPPFVAPHPYKKESGLTSKSINTELDFVANKDQQSNKEHKRESPIGLGYRVPLVIASPWSRGGWVNSQVFDHTSSLQFLEKFLSHKMKKKIEEPNITSWRRAVCGDLSSAFRPYNGEKLDKPDFLDKKEFIESIHKAQYKNPPSNFRKLSKDEIEKVNKAPYSSPHMPSQEKGIRSSCALPYELFVTEKLNNDNRSIEITFKSGHQLFGASSAGSPFQVYAPGIYKNEIMRVWDYAVAAGEEVTDKWSIDEFENSNYHLNVYGPNGFFREFKGNSNDPAVELVCEYVSGLKRWDIPLNVPPGAVMILATNRTKISQTIEITDNAYKTGVKTYKIERYRKKPKTIYIDNYKSYNWYDFSVRIKGNKSFERRYAGRVETLEDGKTDPFMGRVI